MQPWYLGCKKGAVSREVSSVQRCPYIYRGLALCLRTCLLIWQEARVCCTDGRVVKALDSKSNGLCPRRFESCSVRLFFFLFSVGEVEQALQVPPEQFQQNYDATQPHKDQDIVFYCMAGVRSLTALETAQQLGFTK